MYMYEPKDKQAISLPDNYMYMYMYMYIQKLHTCHYAPIMLLNTKHYDYLWLTDTRLIMRYM